MAAAEFEWSWLCLLRLQCLRIKNSNRKGGRRPRCGDILLGFVGLWMLQSLSPVQELFGWKIQFLWAPAISETSWPCKRPSHANPPRRRGGPWGPRTFSVLRWPGLTKSRRLLRPVLLAHTRGTWAAILATIHSSPVTISLLSNFYGGRSI